MCAGGGSQASALISSQASAVPSRCRCCCCRSPGPTATDADVALGGGALLKRESPPLLFCS